MENVQIHRDIKLITTEQEETKLSYCRVFQGASVGYRNDKTKIHMNKPVYLGLLILELSKTLIYELWCDFVKPKYGEKTKLCYMDTDSFIVYKKQMTGDVEPRFDNLEKQIPKKREKKVNGLMKDELGGK